METVVEKEYDCGLEIGDTQKKVKLKDILDPDKLLRLNPFWFVNSVKTEENQFTAELKDYRTDREFQLTGTCIFDKDNLLTIDFSDGEWTSISLFVKESNQLWAKVNFREQVAEPESEEEQNLVYWLRGIKEYLRLYFTNSLNTRFFRIVMNNMILKMNPSQRKICVMIVRFTILEIVVIGIIIAGYFLFMKK